MPRPAPRKPAASHGPAAPAGHGLPPNADPNRPDAPMLLWAYGHAIFPMVDPSRDVIEWFHPDPRGIIPLEPGNAFHIPRNLAREVRKRRFTLRSDTAFERVMRECAMERGADNRSWMNERLLRAYLELFELGHAHSVEAWLDGALVGGLYGVHVGGVFFGESMFSRPQVGGANASKVCLVHLVRWLQARGFLLLDTQFANEHLLQFGCMEISAQEYHARLQRAIAAPVTWGTFRAL
jgi:leucyl/phenylalanyl-tRNA---protein transferase